MWSRHGPVSNSQSLTCIGMDSCRLMRMPPWLNVGDDAAEGPYIAACLPTSLPPGGCPAPWAICPSLWPKPGNVLQVAGQPGRPAACCTGLLLMVRRGDASTADRRCSRPAAHIGLDSMSSKYTPCQSNWTVMRWLHMYSPHNAADQYALPRQDHEAHANLCVYCSLHYSTTC